MHNKEKYDVPFSDVSSCAKVRAQHENKLIIIFSYQLQMNYAFAQFELLVTGEKYVMDT